MTTIIFIHSLTFNIAIKAYNPTPLSPHLTRMPLAKRPPLLRKEALPFEVLFAGRTIEALTVIIIIQSLDPLVPRLNGKATPKAPHGEHLVPICAAVGQPVLHEEGVSVEDLRTPPTLETLHMPLLPHGLETLKLDPLATPLARGGEVLFPAELAVQL